MSGVMDAQLFDRETAETYATWFRALSDPTRIQILNLLAVAGDALSVGEIVKRTNVAQSTVSHHLKILIDVRFVLRQRHGTSMHYRVNVACVVRFPSAADAVMGRQPPEEPRQTVAEVRRSQSPASTGQGDGDHGQQDGNAGRTEQPSPELAAVNRQM
jgi:DNA-binding transcriptional ArsR family regulator